MKKSEISRLSSQSRFLQKLALNVSFSVYSTFVDGQEDEEAGMEIRENRLIDNYFKQCKRP